MGFVFAKVGEKLGQRLIRRVLGKKESGFDGSHGLYVKFVGQIRESFLDLVEVSASIPVFENCILNFVL